MKTLSYHMKYPSNQNNKIATKKRRDKLAAAGLCTSCGKEKAEIGKKKCSDCLAYFVEYNRKNAGKYEPRKKEYRRRLRKEVIQKYGGECDCCGEGKIEFLAIDHLNRDGNTERKQRNGKNKSASYSWYLELKREPRRKDLRVLCHNCNMSIGLYGYCPHDTK